MFENFMTALRVVFPLAALMGIGALVRKGGLVDRPSMRKVDVLSFRLFMPTLLFKNIYESDLLHHSGGLGFVYIPVCMLLLFLVAGVFLAYSYELLPEKKLHLRKTGQMSVPGLSCCQK